MATFNGLPIELANIERVCTFPSRAFRWQTNEEIAAYLLSQGSHKEWLSDTIPERPETGSLFLYSRYKIPKFTNDGHEWKKRSDGRTTREDHMKLKVRSVECLSAVYAHSATIPTFHRRRYWLLKNPGIVLVHYLNVNHRNNILGQSQSLDRLSSIPVHTANTTALPQTASVLANSGDMAVPCFLHSQLNGCVSKELCRVRIAQNSSHNQGHNVTDINWLFNGETVTDSEMTCRTSDFAQNDCIESGDVELTNKDYDVALSSPILSSVSGMCESPYSELLRFLDSPTTSADSMIELLTRDDGEMVVSDPSVLERMEVIPLVSSDRFHNDTSNASFVAGSSTVFRDKNTSRYSTEQMNYLPSVTDFSPDWSYPKGGVKILIVGPWLSVHEDYTCLFDGYAVPAVLVQGGVLRCFCPEHEPGVVNLQVAYGNTISACGTFEYKEWPSHDLSSTGTTTCVSNVNTSMSMDNPFISISPASCESLMKLSTTTRVLESEPNDCSLGMDTLSPLSSSFNQFRQPQSPQDTVDSSPGASPGSFSTLSEGDTNPTVVDWCEFLGDSRNVIEQDFTNLSLTEREQQELYEAAKKIQICFRKYKESRQKAAAIQIQNCYRRYRETRKMNEAAAIIQTQYKKHLQIRKAATVIQQGYRHYSQRKRQRLREES